MSTISEEETRVLQRYLQDKFGNAGLVLRGRKTNDSVEVLMNGEFLGVIYKDEDEGETSYDFNMAILEMDIKDPANSN